MLVGQNTLNRLYTIGIFAKVILAWFSNDITEGATLSYYLCKPLNTKKETLKTVFHFKNSSGLNLTELEDQFLGKAYTILRSVSYSDCILCYRWSYLI